MLYDSVRGVQLSLTTNTTAAEATNSGINTFDSNGFTLGAATQPNANGDNYVAWCWKAGTSWSNSAGTGGATVASSGSRNTTAGFSIASWTHTTSANYSIAHGLTAAPSFVLTKGRNEALNWDIWHKNLASASSRLIFSSSNEISAYWANPANSLASGGPPETATLHGVASTDANGADPMIGYFFVEVDGFSKFGSYTGNGSADGPFVYCGFKPRYIMIKRTDSSVSYANGSWYIVDTARNPSNVAYMNLLSADNSVQEYTENSAITWDLLSNGFKIRGSYSSLNDSGGTYIFAAFAEAPFKYATAR
jgi:hypothetical protein